MPLTPKAKYARKIAERIELGYNNDDLIVRLTPSELNSLAQEYIALFDDYEDRYRRAKVEALEELLGVVDDYYEENLDEIGQDTIETVLDIIHARLRYLKEGGE